MNLSLPQTLFIIISGLALIITIINTFQIYKLRKLRKYLLKYPGFLSQEEWLNRILTDIKGLSDQNLATEHALLKIQNTLKMAIQNIDVSKYNSLPTDGGNFSFSLSFLNSEKTGILISSLYGRDYSRIFVKKIINGVPEIPLTQEENKLLSQIKSTPSEIHLVPEK